ncbi:putative late blight resistance protein homolog R1A-3 [Coffea arabica]|uniref:Late blight resistance protein homolog R1A-3 n=1 Tax=Coffea arabica TaxID=13443 RepID=A0A6P6WZ75_COFAR|nr:putative late blight resistance protein homolog R1B-17 [Coffea arabica]
MEKAAEVAVGFVLQNLVQLIRENRRLIGSDYEKISDLQDDLRLLKTFMADYTEKHYNSSILRALADDIRSRVFEVEDLLDTYNVEKILYKNKNTLSQIVSAKNHQENLRKMGKAVQKLSAKVKRVYDDINDIGGPALVLEEMARHNSIDEHNQIGDNEEADRIIGFTDATDEVLKLLGGQELVQLGKSEAEEQTPSGAEQHGESKQLEVVPIHGMLGLGKTTLAKKVLNDPRIEYHFFTRIFVPVSNVYNKQEVLFSILSAFTENIKDQNLSMKELEDKVKEALKNKYLIVIDDVWATEAWDDLKNVFPDNNKGSRVLITTQLEPVAKYVTTKTEPYKLQFMNDDEAEKLLRTKVFDGNKCPKELLSLERKILAKCQGLPLAIVVIAGILWLHPRDPEWWDDVLHGVAEFVGDSQKIIDDAIRRSYDILHPTLKLCFLYLGVFPEDLEIKASKLWQLWIAEGFIPESENASKEEIAEECLGELVGRNLVMVEQRTLSGRIKTCRIQDMLRYFSKKIAKAEGLFQETQVRTSSSSSARRLFCNNSQFSQSVCEKQPAEKARSFLSFGHDEIKLDPNLSPDDVFKHFKLLQVLDILSVKLPTVHLPKKLSNLVLLKFIAINSEVETLPKIMSSLLNLQTLIVQTGSPTLDIQADIWVMTKLRHLVTNSSMSLPRCQEQSTICLNLQTLSAVSPESLTNELFERATNLKKLGISGNLGVLMKANGESNLFDHFCKLNSLERLKLCSNDVNSKLLALPQPHKFPERLTKLSLQNTSLGWDQMSILGKLRYLEVLKLKDYAFTGEDWQTEEGGFRSLKVLFIEATDLNCWEAQANDFPELRRLILKQCKQLWRIPPDFVDMKKLEDIHLEHTTGSVISSARRIRQSQIDMLQHQKLNDKKTTPTRIIVYPPEY